MQLVKLFALLLCFVSLANAKRLQPERYYQELYANQVGGQVEVTAPDDSRCDILTEDLAIEADFADKWAEAIGQSLSYGFQFNRKPAILLIMEKKEDARHYIRLGSLIRHYTLEIELIPLRVYLDAN